MIRKGETLSPFDKPTILGENDTYAPKADSRAPPRLLIESGARKLIAMANLSLTRTCSKHSPLRGVLGTLGCCAPSKHSRLTVGLLGEAVDLMGTHTSDGRNARAISNLVNAANQGCIPIDNPWRRWSKYGLRPRRVGIIIATHDEPHNGAYAGHHVPYEASTRLARRS